MSSEITPHTLLLNALRKHDTVVLRADAITVGAQRAIQPALRAESDQDAFVILTPRHTRTTSWEADIQVETILAPGVATDGTPMAGAWVETVVGTQALSLTTGSLRIFDEGSGPRCGSHLHDTRPFLDVCIGISELATGSSELYDEARACAQRLAATATPVDLTATDDAIAV